MGTHMSGYSGRAERVWASIQAAVDALPAVEILPTRPMPAFQPATYDLCAALGCDAVIAPHAGLCGPCRERSERDEHERLRQERADARVAANDERRRQELAAAGREREPRMAGRVDDVWLIRSGYDGEICPIEAYSASYAITLWQERTGRRDERRHVQAVLARDWFNGAHGWDAHQRRGGLAPRDVALAWPLDGSPLSEAEQDILWGIGIAYAEASGDRGALAQARIGVGSERRS